MQTLNSNGKTATATRGAGLIRLGTSNEGPAFAKQLLNEALGGEGLKFGNFDGRDVIPGSTAMSALNIGTSYYEIINRYGPVLTHLGMVTVKGDRQSAIESYCKQMNYTKGMMSGLASAARRANGTRFLSRAALVFVLIAHPQNEAGKRLRDSLGVHALDSMDDVAEKMGLSYLLETPAPAAPTPATHVHTIKTDAQHSQSLEPTSAAFASPIDMIFDVKKESPAPTVKNNATDLLNPVVTKAANAALVILREGLVEKQIERKDLIDRLDVVKVEITQIEDVIKGLE